MKKVVDIPEIGCRVVVAMDVEHDFRPRRFVPRASIAIDCAGRRRAWRFHMGRLK